MASRGSWPSSQQKEKQQTKIKDLIRDSKKKEIKWIEKEDEDAEVGTPLFLED